MSVIRFLILCMYACIMYRHIIWLEILRSHRNIDAKVKVVEDDLWGDVGRVLEIPIRVSCSPGQWAITWNHSTLGYSDIGESVWVDINGPIIGQYNSPLSPSVLSHCGMCVCFLLICNVRLAVILTKCFYITKAKKHSVKVFWMTQASYVRQWHCKNSLTDP